MPINKKKRVSKKNKLSWRKHVNIEDVENFLEEKRLEERLGKPVAEKTDAELFKVDVTPTTQRLLTSKQKRRLLLCEKIPKCFSMLQPHSAVPDPMIKRNRVRTKEERKNALVKRKEEDRRRRGILKAKELQSIKDKKLHKIAKANKPKADEFNTNIWHVEDSAQNPLVNEWIEDNTRKHTLRGIGKQIKSIPKSIHTKNSIFPIIAFPHPGTSYNPTFIEHQALLQAVVEKEVKIIKNEKHLARVTRGMFSKVTPSERENNWLVEMSQGMENVDQDINEGDYKPINPPTLNKKKNLKQRRKQREQQQLEQAKRIAKQEKKKIADIYKLKFLKQELEKKQKEEAVSKVKRLEKAKQKETETKRLASVKFEEEEIHFNMPEDIGGSLRCVKKEGSLLADRFKSLQKRNILQPTTHHRRLHAKVKRFTRPGHKEDWKTTVARPTNKAE